MDCEAFCKWLEPRTKKSLFCSLAQNSSDSHCHSLDLHGEPLGGHGTEQVAMQQVYLGSENQNWNWILWEDKTNKHSLYFQVVALKEPPGAEDVGGLQIAFTSRK